MKNLMLLLFALAILVVFGGSAYFLIDISKGARFERLDQSMANDGSPEAPANPEVPKLPIGNE